MCRHMVDIIMYSCEQRDKNLMIRTAGVPTLRPMAPILPKRTEPLPRITHMFSITLYNTNQKVIENVFFNTAQHYNVII